MTRITALAGTSALALCLAAALPARAECIQSGDTVACSGTDTDGFSSSEGSLTLTVDFGARVENATGDAFELHDTDDQSLGNFGEIDSENDRAIDVRDGDGLRVVTAGGITAGDDAIRGRDDMTVQTLFEGTAIVSKTARGIDANDDLHVRNTGTITAENDAIRGNDRMNVINDPTGLIESTSQEGIDAGDGTELTVENTGTIRAGDEGIQAGLRAHILNDAGGRITAVDDAVQVEGDSAVLNDGTILSENGDGIDIDSGRVFNSFDGIIGSKSTTEAGIDVDAIPAGDLAALIDPTLDIYNLGEIYGGVGILVDPANTQSQLVRGGGTITGSTGIAIDLGAGADSVDTSGPFGTMTIHGQTLFGSGDDLLRVGVHERPGDRVGGRNAFFDGGSEDTADTIEFTVSSLSDVFLFDDRDASRVRMGFEAGGREGTLIFTDFERFSFTDGTVLASDIVAPVPLPASAGFLLAGMGVLWVASRRRARREA